MKTVKKGVKSFIPLSGSILERKEVFYTVYERAQFPVQLLGRTVPYSIWLCVGSYVLIPCNTGPRPFWRVRVDVFPNLLIIPLVSDHTFVIGPLPEL